MAFLALLLALALAVEGARGAYYAPPTYPSAPYPRGPSHPSPSKGNAVCRDSWYPKCFGKRVECPASCAQSCQMDCKTCKAVCPCDRPGGVCQDPRLVGADGVTFYFHGVKDKDFCLLSDSHIHINAHFIGKRVAKMRRDFTWVQSIAVFLKQESAATSVLHISANANVSRAALTMQDQLTLSVDGKQVEVPAFDGASVSRPLGADGSYVSFRRLATWNAVKVEVAERMAITARVVCIGREESRVHGYDVSDDDCFAHLDLTFNFMSLSSQVDGVLGHTYSPTYTTPSQFLTSNKMHVLGSESKYQTSDLFVPDCQVSRFSSSLTSDDGDFFSSSLKCLSGLSGHGIVCRR